MDKLSINEVEFEVKFIHEYGTFLGKTIVTSTFLEQNNGIIGCFVQEIGDLIITFQRGETSYMKEIPEDEYVFDGKEMIILSEIDFLYFNPPK